MQRPRYMAAGRVSNSSDARSLTASCHRVSVLHSHAQIAQLIESSQGICACPTEPSWSTSTSVAGLAPHMHRPDAWCPEPNPKPRPRYSRPARPSEARQGVQLALGTAAAMHRRDVALWPQASSRAAAARAATGVLTTVVSSATRSIEFMPVAASRGSFYQAESAQLEVLVDRALAPSACAWRRHSK